MKKNSIDLFIYLLKNRGYLSDVDVAEVKAMHKEEIDQSYRDGFEFALINECAKQSTSDASQYAEGYSEGYKRALDYMADTIKNKIEIKENSINNFATGTTSTAFLCTQFVADRHSATTSPNCIKCGKQFYQHPIISNTI
jgi:hypothetical protein